MQIKSWIITILAILFVVSSIWLYDYFTLPSHGPVYGASFIKQDLGTRVLVIDLNADLYPTLSKVFSGDDAILVLHKDATATNHAHDLLVDQAVLGVVTAQTEGRLDGNDPVFPQLELLTFQTVNGQLQPHYISLGKAGIRTVYFDPKYVIQHSTMPADQLPHPIGTVIMADGSARLIRDMVIDARYVRASGAQ